MRIFNLAEELEKERKKNKELEEKIKELKADYGNKAQVERDLLQIRIDKAIEYINVINEITPSSPRKDIARMILLREDMLLDILKGDNK